MTGRFRSTSPCWIRVLAFSIVALLSAGGCSGGGTAADDAAPIDTNTSPSASIDSPNDGQTVTSGQSVDFVGKVYDGEDTSEALTVQWVSDWQGELGTGKPNPFGIVTMTLESLDVGIHQISLTVTDSKGATGSASIQLHVVAEEVALAVVIAPADPTTSEPLTASIVGGHSADVTYLYHWNKDAVDSGLEGTTVPSDATSKSETWTVTVNAVETSAHGEASVTILNTPPTCTQVTLLPQAAPSNEPRVCTCTQWKDPDGGDTAQDSCVFRDTQDAELANAPTVGDDEEDDDSCTLQPSSIVKGMQVVCTLTPNDGEGAGEAMDSDTSSVMNSAPSEPSNVAIGSLDPEPTIQSQLTCTYDETATDSDGDPLVYSVSWVVDDIEYPGSSESVVLADVDLSACEPCVKAGSGSAVRCRVRACENIGGDACSASVDSDVLTLGNLPPTGGSALVGVEPVGPVTENSTLTCLTSGAADPEGSEITWDITWEIKPSGADVFTLVEGANAAVLTGTHFDKGDTIRCVARPKDTDGGMGDPVTSKDPYPLAVNSIPALIDVSLYPEGPTRQDTLICAFTWVDPDEADPIQIDVAWIKKGADNQEAVVLNALVDEGSDITMAASLLVPGDQVWCELDPMNGVEAGVTVVSNVVTVINQAPTAPVVALTLPDILPGTGALSGDAKCTISTAASDADGDELNVSFQMTVNGVETPNQKGTIAVSLLSHCDLVTCVAIADDGWPDGATSSDEKKGQLAAGPDCPTAGFCELPTCLETGGCGPSFFDEDTCDDGLYCNGLETCDITTGCVLGLPPQEDNNPCTSDSCYEASEGVPSSKNCIASTEGTLCNAPDFASQTPCDDGDPCTPIDLCEGGECLAQSDNICIEEPLSVFNDSTQAPAIANLGYGRYVTRWKSAWDGASVVRVTDGNGSRLDEEHTLDGKPDLDIIQAGVVALPGGRFIVADVLYEWTGPSIFHEALLTLSKYTLTGTLEAQSSTLLASNQKVPNPNVRNVRLRLLLFSDGGLGMVQGGTYSSAPAFASVDSTDLSVGGWIPLMETTMAFQSVKFDAKTVATKDAAGEIQSEGFRAAWVGYPSALSPYVLWLDSYDQTGAPADDWPASALNIGNNCTSPLNQCVKKGAIQVEYKPVPIQAVRLAVLSTGDNVVVWERGVNLGNTIHARVIGNDGAYLSAVFPMLPAGLDGGDQNLGDVGVFSDDHVIVVYSDNTLPSKEGEIRYWIFDPDNPSSPSSSNVVNVKGIGNQVFPSVTVFPGKSGTGADDEFVVTFVSNGMVYTRRLNRDGTPAIGIPERRGNVAYEGTQYAADAASARPALGQPTNVFVVYSSQEPLVSKETVFGRLFSNDGVQILPEQALTNVVFHATEPAIAGSGDRFVFTYTRAFNVGDDGDVRARFYNGKGVEVSDPNLPVAVPTSSGKDQQGARAAVGLETVLVAWSSNHDENNYTVYGRLFDHDGVALSDPFSVNESDTKKQWQVNVAAQPTGERYALAWTTNKKGTKDIILRLLDAQADGQVSFVTDEVAVFDGMGQQTRASVAMASDGQVVVCFEWTGLGVDDDGDVACKRYVWVEGMLMATNNDDVFYPFVYAPAWQQAPRVSFLNDTDFVVAWEASDLDHSEHAIQMRHYSAANILTSKGARVVANRTWAGNQSRPFVVDASVGTYWIGWDSTPPVGTVTAAGTDVYFRVFPKN